MGTFFCNVICPRISQYRALKGLMTGSKVFGLSLNDVSYSYKRINYEKSITFGISMLLYWFARLFFLFL